MSTDLQTPPRTVPEDVPRLTIEALPSSTWEVNLRTMLSSAAWKQLRTDCYRRAGYRCEICGGRGPRHPVECHEVWHFDDARAVQTLVRLIALCPSCHLVKHFGFACVTGRAEEAFAHLLRVNGWTPAQGDAHVDQARRQWQARNERTWTVDMSVLATLQRDIRPTDGGSQEAGRAERRH